MRRSLLMAVVSMSFPLSGLGSQGHLEAQDREQAPAEPPAELPARIVVTELGGQEAEDVEGVLVLTQSEDAVLVEAHVTGLDPGTHQVVVRETSTCDPGAESASRATRAGEIRAAQTESESGRSQAPEGEAAADPEELAIPERRIGELEVGRDGAARYRLLTDVISLEEDAPDSVIGKAFVIEPHPLANGAAGDEGAEGDVLCGVVGIAG